MSMLNSKEEAVKITNLLINYVKDTMFADNNDFMSSVCMIIEEGCRARGMDAIKVSGQIAQMVKAVTEELGVY